VGLARGKGKGATASTQMKHRTKRIKTDNLTKLSNLKAQSVLFRLGTVPIRVEAVARAATVL
jgi:hypothetical protein